MFSFFVFNSKPKKEFDLALTKDERETVCWREIFDYLPFKDLISIGLTGKRLRKLAGTYFAQNYPSAVFFFDPKPNGEVVHEVNIPITDFSQPRYETNFDPVAQSVCFDRDDIDVFRFAASNTYPRLRRIIFIHCEKIAIDHIVCLVKMGILAKISAIELNHCTAKFQDQLLNFILPLCTNLRELTIYEMQSVSVDPGWVRHHCSTLEYFKTGWLYELSEEGLPPFLRANPQIKNLSISDDTNDDDSVLQTIKTVGLRLDEFAWELLPEDDEDRCRRFTAWINALAASGHIKHFKVKLSWIPGQLESSVWIKHLKDIRCLTSLQIKGMSSDVMDSLLPSLKNLEELHLMHLRSDLRFARHFPKLRVIKVMYAWDSQLIDLMALNADRENLPDAEVLQIYLRDELYNKVRWSNVELLNDKVQIRRWKY